MWLVTRHQPVCLMTTIYWVCLLGGLGFTVLVLFVGDMLEGVLDALDSLDGIFIDPLSIVAGIAGFGAAGIVLDATTALSESSAAWLAGGIGLLLAVVMHFMYVRPMKRGEVSTGFSIQEYRGRIGEVITTIPSVGYGEVLVQMGGTNTSREALSFSGHEIAAGTQVVVVEIRDNDLLVAPLEEASSEPNLLISSS